MKFNLNILLAVCLTTTFLLFSGCMESSDSESGENNISESRIFELRTYTTYEGKLDDLHQRFENHTMSLFEKHGMTNIGYWTPETPELKDNTLIYLLAHESRDAAEQSWQAFRDDPVWQNVYQESRSEGPIVEHVESVFMTRTPYSPM